ncbi:hypothetical protein CC80DRAFT_505477 [Byssothecium circinans]|uniref:Uncharacterized protein n=1 Tax=Byssothecium circinans TaxID=147558 RepID=A0A6A5TRN6_9PLEO|nr:hypothetical protein CC80DRAFT_505477 [Byssothecium circinans]
MASRGTQNGRRRNDPPTTERAPKRPKVQQATHSGTFSCFTIDGNDANLHRRSAFTQKRKEEVRSIRKRGACLRCRLLKRACSGEDPCKTCMVAARAAANSKALMWMECIRPSFQAMNIFNTIKCTAYTATKPWLIDVGHNVPNQARINSIMTDLLNDDVHLDFHIPFALNVEAASSHLSRWLSDDDSPSTFSVVGVFSCSSNTNLLQNSLDPSLARDLRLFVHLTTHLYTTGMQGGYQEYTDGEIQSVRDCVGNRLLTSLESLLRPSEIEASEDKLGKLRSLFLLILGTVVGMRYTCPEVFEGTAAQCTEHEAKQEALLRLLCHYLIYIGKATALLEAATDEKTLLDRWRNQWNKPAAFTWSSTQGLEMHYRIEPPADWIVSSTEDESLSSIDIDLSEFDDLAQFTQDSDLLKCTTCDNFWTSLDENGVCQICQVDISLEDDPSHALWEDLDFSLDEASLNISLQSDILPGLPDLSQSVEGMLNPTSHVMISQSILVSASVAPQEELSPAILKAAKRFQHDSNPPDTEKEVVIRPESSVSPEPSAAL